MSGWDPNSEWPPRPDQQPPPPPQQPPPPPGWNQQAPYGRPQQPPPIGRYEGGAKKTFELGPMTLADILDAAFRLIKQNWRSIFLVVLAFSVPVAVFSSAVGAAIGKAPTGFGTVFNTSTTTDTGSTDAGTQIAALILLVSVSLFTSVFVMPFVSATLARVVAATYLGGNITAGQAAKGILPLWFALVAASVLVHLAELGGFAACILPGFALVVLFTSVIPILAVEGGKPVDAIMRSWALMKTRFWDYLLIVFVTYLVSTSMGFVVSFVPSLVGQIFAQNHQDLIYWIFTGLTSVLTNLVTLPIGAVVGTLIYFDSRVRNEGFDVQVAAARLARTQGGGVPPNPITNG